MTTQESIQETLHALKDDKYRDFHSSLTPGAENILGVRVPQLRTLAKEIAKSNDWKSFIEMEEVSYYEETMLQGMVIGLAKMDYEERIKYISLFIPRINNWAVCDIFCGELKNTTKKEREKMWDFIQTYLVSDKEFEIRFGIVMLLHYIDEEHIDSILQYSNLFHHEAYYARMAMAWTLSTCLVKYTDKTIDYLEESNLDNWTFNKAIQKATESLRIDNETKALLRSMKRK